MNNKPKFKLMGLRQLFLPENLLHEDRPYWAEKGIDNLIKKFELIERSKGEKEFEDNLEEKKSDPKEEVTETPDISAEPIDSESTDLK